MGSIFVFIATTCGFVAANFALAARSAGAGRPTVWLVGLAAFALPQISTLGMAVRRATGGLRLPWIIDNLGFYLLMASLFLFVFFVVANLARLTHLTPVWLTRPREVMLGVALVVLYLGGGAVNARFARFTEYSLATDKKGVDMTLVLIADLHIDNDGISKPRLANVVERVNALTPDVVLLAGDIVDNFSRPFVEGGWAQVMAKLAPKHGVYAITGNHEFYGEGVDAVVAAVSKDSGITFLRDRSQKVEGLPLTLVGRDDMGGHGHGRPGGNKPVRALMEGTDPADYRIVMIHRPMGRGGDMAEFMGDADLAVSGHSHNGQVFPANIMVKYIYENPWGLLARGAQAMITTCGLGLWGPAIRIGSHPEVVVIRVKSRA
ncbi:hypothetical protein FACS1894186_0340 [Alphaproteobacteria bacterium]|nr:hypothetical protein FACS1894186_0340 [Alphaproteobacteria bacterium]